MLMRVLEYERNFAHIAKRSYESVLARSARQLLDRAGFSPLCELHGRNAEPTMACRSAGGVRSLEAAGVGTPADMHSYHVLAGWPLDEKACESRRQARGLLAAHSIERLAVIVSTTRGDMIGSCLLTAQASRCRIREQLDDHATVASC